MMNQGIHSNNQTEKLALRTRTQRISASQNTQNDKFSAFPEPCPLKLLHFTNLHDKLTTDNTKEKSVNLGTVYLNLAEEIYAP